MFFCSGPYVVAADDHVLAHVEGDLFMGRVERVSPMPEPDPDQVALGREVPVIFRTATADDMARDRENRELSRKAFELCRQCIQERSLDMKLVDVVALFDGGKILFFFTAPSRIDFRELVKDLVRAFRTRIELRQIGARHETQMIGGIGNCGQLVCCQRFLRQFAPSTIKMAKEQNLFLNPAKISGVCNRLLCCLSYEQGNYEEFLAQCPKVGKKFATALGPAKVLRANYFRRSLNVWLDSGGEREIDLEEWFALVAAGRAAATGKQDVSARAKIVEPKAVSAQPETLSSETTSVPAADVFSKKQPDGPRSDTGQAAQAEARRSKSPDGDARGKAKKEGKSGSRKSKRRSRSSRNRSQARAQSSGSAQNQPSGKSQKKSSGKS